MFATHFSNFLEPWLPPGPSWPLVTRKTGLQRHATPRLVFCDVCPNGADISSVHPGSSKCLTVSLSETSRAWSSSSVGFISLVGLRDRKVGLLHLTYW